MKLSVCHLLLPPLLLLFYCHSLAALHGKVDVDNQHSILKTNHRFKVKRSNQKVNQERSKDHFLTTNSSRADFPCPESAAIAPCTCTVDNNDLVYFDCTFVESMDQLVNVFQQEFPVKELYEFSMANNSAIKGFPSFMNGITFERVNLDPGPFILEGISEHFLFDLRNTLKEFVMFHGKLATDFFPFFMLPSMGQLEHLRLYFSDINWIPSIQGPKLINFVLEYSPLELLVNGTFPIGTEAKTIGVNYNQIHTIEVGSIFFVDQNSAASNELIHIDMYGNQLQSLKTGTIPLRNGETLIHIENNQISSIEPGTFVLPASTDLLTIELDLGENQLRTFDEAVFGNIMPFITTLYLRDNPLTCGCDVAWLILNQEFIASVDVDATCASGTNLHDLDPQAYIDFC